MKQLPNRTVEHLYQHKFITERQYNALKQGKEVFVKGQKSIMVDDIGVKSANIRSKETIKK